MIYSDAFRKNGDDSIQRIAPMLAHACLEDAWNGWGLQENLKHILLDRGYAPEDAAHDARALFLQVKHGIISTTDTLRQYDYVDASEVVPA